MQNTPYSVHEFSNRKWFRFLRRPPLSPTLCCKIQAVVQPQQMNNYCKSGSWWLRWRAWHWCMLSSEWFTGIFSLTSNISEHSACSIVIWSMRRTLINFYTMCMK
jgi:hypothetical protein